MGLKEKVGIKKTGEFAKQDIAFGYPARQNIQSSGFENNLTSEGRRGNEGDKIFSRPLLNKLYLNQKQQKEPSILKASNYSLKQSIGHYSGSLKEPQPDLKSSKINENLRRIQQEIKAKRLQSGMKQEERNIPETPLSGVEIEEEVRSQLPNQDIYKTKNIKLPEDVDDFQADIFDFCMKTEVDIELIQDQEYM